MMMKKVLILLMVIVFGFQLFAANSDNYKDRPSVALVLSGGGAKGIVHIGILEEIEKLGIPVDKVYGTSMGSLIGGFYCAGYSPSDLVDMIETDDLTQLFTSFLSSGYNEVLDAFDYNSNNVISISLSQGIGGITGIIDDYQILNFFYKNLGNIPENLNFETDLEIPFNCNAINMINGKEVVFKDGSLIQAMRSSMSIPIVFEPVDTGSEILMDGGLYDNMPVHLAIEDGYDIIIAVSANSPGDIDYNTYKTFSGTLMNLTTIIVRRGMEGESESATLFIPVETGDFSVLGFAKSDEILKRGRDTAKAYHDSLKQIADLFTEEQKEYKDPERLGTYFTKYDKKHNTVIYKSAADTRKEDLMEKSRLSFGLYGGFGFSFNLKEEQSFANRDYPTVSFRLFLKDIKESPVSIDTRIKFSLNIGATLSSELLWRLTEDYGERLFVTGKIGATAGNLTAGTDRYSMISLNQIEFGFNSNLGLKLTNEKNHIINLKANGNIWKVLNFSEIEDDEMLQTLINPSIQLDGIFYPKYKTGLFGNSGTRTDFLVNVGYFRNIHVDTKNLSYKIKFAFESAFKLSENDSIWFEGSAFSNRDYANFRDYRDDYGGWNGMPGENYGNLYSDILLAGVGYQRRLKTNILTGYFVSQFKVGLHSAAKFEFWDGLFSFFNETTYTPFYYCFNDGLFDLGLAVGYGINTPMGDIILGIGINSDYSTSVYLEIQ